MLLLRREVVLVLGVSRKMFAIKLLATMILCPSVLLLFFFRMNSSSRNVFRRLDLSFVWHVRCLFSVLSNNVHPLFTTCVVLLNEVQCIKFIWNVQIMLAIFSRWLIASLCFFKWRINKEISCQSSD